MQLVSLRLLDQLGKSFLLRPVATGVVTKRSSKHGWLMTELHLGRVVPGVRC